MNGGERDDFIDAMKKYGRMYPDAGYGGRFGAWINSDNREPYNSYGNGSAMRVSPCAWMMDCGFCARTGMWPSNGRERAKTSAEVTHNHPEGIKGAMATADAIFMCRYYFGGYYGDYEQPINDDPAECKRRIKEHIETSMATTFPRRWMKSVPHTASMRPARILYRRPLSLSWKARTSRTPSETPSPLVVTATPSRRSRAVSQRRPTVFPTGLRTRLIPIWMSR